MDPLHQALHLAADECEIPALQAARLIETFLQALANIQPESLMEHLGKNIMALHFHRLFPEASSAALTVADIFELVEDYWYEDDKLAQREECIREVRAFLWALAKPGPELLAPSIN